MSIFARSRLGSAILLALMAVTAPALANDFTVSPTSIKVAPGNQVATLTVKVGGPGITQGQVRVVRWHRDSGAGRLEATRDVVASPPAMRMSPNQELTIRLVRTATTAMRGEECYRVLVDQLPSENQQGQVVRFTVRHSVPLCFNAPS
jgi:fimbrial chaperone protein